MIARDNEKAKWGKKIEKRVRGRIGGIGRDRIRKGSRGNHSGKGYMGERRKKQAQGSDRGLWRR